MPYVADGLATGFRVLQTTDTAMASPFASSYCIVTGNLMRDTVDMYNASSALLCDLSDQEVLYAKDVYETLHPASLTKIMTALVALKYGDMSRTLIATSSVIITEPGAQLCGLKSGDTMTMDQALRVLLLYSANDVAMMIAENVGQTVEHFVEMMNEEAIRIGATNTHFANPHGLTQEEHYTTAYDQYLIFNAAIANETFKEIIHMTEYQTVYYDLEGDAKELSLRNTNQYLNGNRETPQSISVIGGKTGTTNAAGHCLILLAKDTAGNPYISVILNATTRDDLYAQMSDLLEVIKE
jgi:D-alanyl-D-alanine carboxypeptidase